jgi:hypothetical protein
MARGIVRTPAPNIVEINSTLREMNDQQLRLVIVLMASGKTFQEAYEVAKTYEQKGE